MKINLLGTGLGLGQKHKGLELTPDALRENGFLEILRASNIEYADHGNMELKADDTLWSYLKKLQNKCRSLISDDSLLINLGGDHSIAMSTVGATLDQYPKARLIWVDAHGDMNTPHSSLTGNPHGMPLAALLGLFQTALDLKKINQDDLILIGVRDLDPFEQQLIEALQIEIIPSSEIKKDPAKSLNRLKSWIFQKSSELHLSFDIDAVDPAYASATGLNVAEGLTPDFIINLVQLVTSTKKLVSLDLVELNLLQSKSKDDERKSIQIFLDILTTIVKSTSKEIKNFHEL